MRVLAQEAATLAMEGLEADANSTKAAVKHVRAAVCPAPVAHTDTLVDSGCSCSAVPIHCAPSVVTKARICCLSAFQICT